MALANCVKQQIEQQKTSSSTRFITTDPMDTHNQIRIQIINRIISPHRTHCEEKAHLFCFLKLETQQNNTEKNTTSHSLPTGRWQVKAKFPILNQVE